MCCACAVPFNCAAFCSLHPPPATVCCCNMQNLNFYIDLDGAGGGNDDSVVGRLTRSISERGQPLGQGHEHQLQRFVAATCCQQVSSIMSFLGMLVACHHAMFTHSTRTTLRSAQLGHMCVPCYISTGVSCTCFGAHADDAGGRVVGSLDEATHAVLRHEQQAAYSSAVHNGMVDVVSPEWVCLSLNKGALQQEVSGESVRELSWL